MLAVDPGRARCGIAVVSGRSVLARSVVAREALGEALAALRRRFAITEALVGDRTGAADVVATVRREMPGLPVALVDEAGTTLEARRLYFADHPPRGWRRLLPSGMRTPPEPYDDYAAVALARRRFAGGLPPNFHRASPEEEESP